LFWDGSVTVSKEVRKMKTKQFVRFIAGTVITSGLLLGWFVNEWFYLITAFAGLNLLQSSLTGFCPPEKSIKIPKLKTLSSLFPFSCTKPF